MPRRNETIPGDDSAERLWRVFYTRPRAEKAVRDRLARAGFEPLLVEREVLRQWSDRKKRVREPLFPCYLFVPVTERERLDVLQDEGVVRNVSFAGRPATVQPDEIERLMALQAVPDRIEAVAREAMPKGTEVIAVGGPLKGVRGRVSGHPKDLYLTVEVESLRQCVRVQVPAAWVMRTADAAA